MDSVSSVPAVHQAQGHRLNQAVEAADQGAPTSGEQQAPLYQLVDVTRTYPSAHARIEALKGVNLEIASGDFVTIQGPTGGGKSTLLQILGALDRPSSGTLTLDGADITTASNSTLTTVRAEQIGFVFQGFNLIATLSAYENVNTALEGRGIAQNERDKRVREALRRVGLADRAEHRPGQLSGGQQQRVAIARAIVANPRVLLADEPTGNLDEAMRNEILTLLQTLNRDGLTIVAVTHDSAVAARAHRRLRLENGRIREERASR